LVHGYEWLLPYFVRQWFAKTPDDRAAARRPGHEYSPVSDVDEGEPDQLADPPSSQSESGESDGDELARYTAAVQYLHDGFRNGFAMGFLPTPPGTGSDDEEEDEELVAIVTPRGARRARRSALPLGLLFLFTIAIPSEAAMQLQPMQCGSKLDSAEWPRLLDDFHADRLKDFHTHLEYNRDISMAAFAAPFLLLLAAVAVAAVRLWRCSLTQCPTGCSRDDLPVTRAVSTFGADPKLRQSALDTPTGGGDGLDIPAAPPV
jgi:hypothetical protein